MALTPKETKLGPRRPAGGYSNNLKTKAGGVGELAGERVQAPKLKPGPTPKQWDGKKVAGPPKLTDAPMQLQERTITPRQD